MTPKKKRVVITGLGTVSCYGNDVNNFYQNLLNGKSGISPIVDFDVSDFPTRFAGVISNFDPGEYLDKKQARRVDKFIAYATVAGKKALEDAGLSLHQLSPLDRSRCGITIGSGMGGMTVFYEGAVTLHEKGHRRVTPFFVPFTITNMAGGLLGIDTGFMGPNYSVSTACATGNNAILAALRHLQYGDADLMICGGTEAPINRIGVAGFVSCKALSERNETPEKASRPWDKDRDGFVMGEGAGILVLETLEHAQKRGAHIYAELLGGALSCDAHHMTEPHPEGLGVELCIRNALRDADVAPERVNYINAHATSTSVGDLAEIRAMKKVFDRRDQIAVNATKSMIGHGLGAAGGFEAIVLTKAIESGMIHPTLNLDNREEEVDFFIPQVATPWKVDVALSNSFGFGGHNAVLVMTAYQA